MADQLAEVVRFQVPSANGNGTPLPVLRYREKWLQVDGTGTWS